MNILKCDIDKLDVVYNIDEYFIENDTLKYSKVIDDELNNLELSQLQISNSLLKNVKFIQCSLDSAYFNNVIFNNCDFSNINLSKSTFKNVELNNCKLIGTDITKSFMDNLYINDSKANNILLDYSKIYNCKFIDSMFKDASITNCKFKNDIINNIDFRYANFSNTSLNGIDLSTCNIGAITVYPNDIKGAILTEYQALDFIKLLGIKIK